MNWFTWALASALFAGITAILAKVGVGAVNPNLATAIRTSVAFLFAWGLAFALVPGRLTLSGIPSRGWLFLTLSGIATGLSWICYFKALSLGDVSRVAPVDKLSVVFALLFAALFLGEHLTLKEGIGAGLILVGALVIAWK